MRDHFVGWRRGLMMAACCLGAWTPAQAETIRVSFDAVLQPIAYTDADGKPAGFAADYVRTVAKEAGLDVEFVTGPKEQLQAEFRAGRAQVVAALVMTDERAKVMDFTLPYLTMRGAVFARRGGKPFRTVADFSGRRVAVSRGNVTHDYMVAHPEWGAVLVPVDSTEVALRLVQSGECDAAVNVDLVAQKIIRDGRLDQVMRTEVELPGLVYKYHMAVHKGDAALLRRLNEAQLAVHERGDYAELYEKWIGPLKAHGIAWRELRPFFMPAALLLLLVVVAFAWQRQNLKKLSLQAEELRRSETRLNLVLQSGRHSLWDWDVVNDRMVRGPMLARLLSYEPEEIAPDQDGLARFVHPEDRDAGAKRLAAIVATPGQDDFAAESRIRAKSGEWRWFATAGRVLERDARGHALRVVGTHTDIMARKEAERSLRESEERFRRLTENAPDVIFRYRFEPTPAYDYVSPAIERISGYKPEEFYSDPLLAGKLAHPDDCDKIHLILASREAPGGAHEIRWLARDGRTIVTEQRFVPIRDEQGRVIALEGIARDITARKLSEEQIQLLSQAVAQSPVAVAIADVDHRLVFVNDRYCEIGGYSREELLGRSTLLARSDLMTPDALAAIREHVRGGSAWHGEYGIRRKDGQVRTLRATITAIRDAAGAVTHSVGVAEDITDLKQELQRRRALELQLNQAQKMESIGVLAGGIAHDFNNVLTGILGFAEIGQHSLKDARTLADCLAEIRKAGLRARDLVAQILTFSRQREAEQVPLELSRIVADAVKFLRASTPALVRIERQLGSGTVRADPTQLHQVVLNLATNAVHAMRNGPGLLSVAVERVNVDVALAAQMPNVVPGPFMRLSVRDTGHGMDADTLKRIFDPFFTTKPSGEGTGLGLAVVQGIVRAHRGGILVESAVGRGTTFHVFLPVCVTTAVEKPAVVPVARGNGEHILLVDDEVSVGQFASARLEQLHFRVSLFSDPVRAIEAARAAPHSFDAIVSDFAMPGLTGMEFVRRVREHCPGLPVVITTGNRTAIAPGELASLGGAVLVDKPFTGDDLARALQSVLPAKAELAQR